MKNRNTTTLDSNDITGSPANYKVCRIPGPDSHYIDDEGRTWPELYHVEHETTSLHDAHVQRQALDIRRWIISGQVWDYDEMQPQTVIYAYDAHGRRLSKDEWDDDVDEIEWEEVANVVADEWVILVMRDPDNADEVCEALLNDRKLVVEIVATEADVEAAQKRTSRPCSVAATSESPNGVVRWLRRNEDETAPENVQVDP